MEGVRKPLKELDIKLKFWKFWFKSNDKFTSTIQELKESIFHYWLFELLISEGCEMSKSQTTGTANSR